MLYPSDTSRLLVFYQELAIVYSKWMMVHHTTKVLLRSHILQTLFSTLLGLIRNIRVLGGSIADKSITVKLATYHA